jgi:hypothetical protein
MWIAKNFEEFVGLPFDHKPLYLFGDLLKLSI